MRHLPLLSLVVLGAALLAGCGGGGENPGQPETLQPGFYRGTVTFAEGSVFSGTTAPVIGDFAADGSFTLSGYTPPTIFDLASDGATGTLTTPGTVLNGSIIQSYTAGTFFFRLHEGNTEFVSGSMTRAPLPMLGTQTTTPPAGVYRGEVLVVNDGRAVGVGRVTDAVISADGAITAPVGGGGSAMGSGTFTAQFNGDGTLETELLSGPGP